MKAITLALAITFAAAGVVSPAADARPGRHAEKKARKHRRAEKKARKHRRAERKARKHRRAHRAARKPARRYRTPGRRYRKPARRYRSPAQRYRKPGRRYRKPARRYHEPARYFRKPGRRYHSPGWRRILKTIQVVNNHGTAIRVQIRAGRSPVCAANPSRGTFLLAAGTAARVSTRGAYVCYRRLPTRFHAGSAWYRSVITARFMRLPF